MIGLHNRKFTTMKANYLRYAILLLLIIPENVLTIDEDESLSMQISAIGAVHSRLRSVYQKTKNGREKRRRNRLSLVELPEPVFIEDQNFYLPDTPDNHNFAKVRKIKQKSSKEKKNKMPRIYITKLPVEQIKKETEIFFTKLLQENDTSVAVIDNLDENKKGDNSSSVIFKGTLSPKTISQYVIQLWPLIIVSQVILSRKLYCFQKSNINKISSNSGI